MILPYFHLKDLTSGLSKFVLTTYKEMGQPFLKDTWILDFSFLFQADWECQTIFLSSLCQPWIRDRKRTWKKERKNLCFIQLALVIIQNSNYSKKPFIWLWKKVLSNYLCSVLLKIFLLLSKILLYFAFYLMTFDDVKFTWVIFK